MIRVMICDDLDEIRKHFRNMLSEEEDIEVIAEASSGKEAVEIALKCKPDIILMDVQMETVDAGITATRKITDNLPNTKVIILTIYNNDEYIVEAYVAGAVDYIIKEHSKQEICDSIRKVYESDYFIGARIINQTRNKLSLAIKREKSIIYFINNIARLTVTEKKILKHLYNGKRRKEIAELEFVSEESVKWHIRHILKKLDFSSTAEMIAFLKDIGIFSEFDI